MSKTMLLFIICLGSLQAYCQENWKQATEQDGIKVYLKNAENTDLKMLKVTCELPASQDAVLALLLDIPASEKWIPQTKSWHYVQRLPVTDFYYYSELRMPWPVSNRDYVVHMRTSQHPTSKVVTLDANAVGGYVPEKGGVVRIKMSIVKWVLTPLPGGSTQLVYELFTNPGGSIPVWVVNYFAKQAAIDIIKKMRELVQQAPYKNANLPFIAK